jgi:citrate lyase subunit beta / citryl-CoA lyase
VDDRLRRSLLYVPASSEAMLRKAGSRGADVLIVDLEDGVLPEAKDEARARAERLWPEVDQAPAEALLRVNAPGTPWHEADIDAARRARPAGVVLPKCEEPAAVGVAGAQLVGMPLYLMVETARGVLAAAELARVEGVAGLLFGAADFRASVRAGRDPGEAELLLARGTLVLAARAAGILVFDTPFFDYRDEAGLEASARRARLLGFEGKTCIHPAQVAAVNRVFAPSAAEVERARAVLGALEAAAREGRGVATVDGEMVEGLHAAEARRTLARARQAGILAGDAAAGGPDREP